MPFRPQARGDDARPAFWPFRRSGPRSTSARIAFVVLAGGVALVLARASVATVIQVHGDGMAPTILDGDSVLMVRGQWSLEHGDIVVYDPTPIDAPLAPDATLEDPLPDPERDGRTVDASDPDPGPRLRNTSVVEADDVENNWERVRARAQKGAPARNFRVARVIARPGDEVTFHHPEGVLGIAVNGRPLAQKPADPVHLVLAAHEEEGALLHAIAYEHAGDARYPILLGETNEETWSSMALPDSFTPTQIRATGYLLLADNRDEGACCDSRRLGFVPAARIRGEVSFRLAGDPARSPDTDPRSRALKRLP